MRTVDPELWSKKLKKPGIQVARCNKFGQHPGCRYETVFRESLVDAALEFWENCSAPAVKYINMEDTSRGERCYYVLLLFLTLGLGTFVVSYNSMVFYVTPPLVISRRASDVFITQVNFPAVALCSNNIISRAALLNYTEFLFNHPKNQKRRHPYSMPEIERNLHDLGALLILALPPLQLQFDSFLLDVDPHFNVTDIMFRLAPACSSILTRCSWRGRLEPCDSLFASRVTPLGFCCVFNSRYYAVDANNAPRVLDLVGQNYGLGVVLTEDRDDFRYMRRNGFGAEMLLFEGSEYPLLEAGDARLYPISRNQSLYINVRVLSQQANDDIRYYSEEWRGCRTSGPGQSRCLAACRRGAAAALCGCVPFALLGGAAAAGPAGAGPARTTRVCALRDLPCLNKYREKFMYLFPSAAAEHDGQLREEQRDGLLCPCRVRCRRQLYSAAISYSQYKQKARLFHNLLTEGVSFANASTIRLYYSSEHQDLYALEAHMRWYEVVVKLSTQWTVVAGVSAMGAVELFYHCTFRWLHHFVKRLRIANLRPPATSM